MTAIARADKVAALDVEALRREFPLLDSESRGHPLVYLDSAATSQKPVAVIEAVSEFYRHHNANIHRGVYQLSEEATALWDEARKGVATFLGAPSEDGVVFVRGTTEAINLVAHGWVRPRAALKELVVVVSEMEHHANIVPWQLAGATTIPIPVTADGALDLSAAAVLIGAGPALLAITHVSNTLGTINPVRELCAMARAAGVVTVIDGAQAAPHLPIDVGSIECDFYCFSGHKVFGPTGIGALWGRPELLQSMPPFQGGGDMIDQVTFAGSTFAESPRRFEAGTPDIAGAIGLHAAIRWLQDQDRAAISDHEGELLREAAQALRGLSRVRLVAAPERRAPVLSFTVDGVHPHDVASILDSVGVCVRAGHHCTQPLHRRLGLAATVRASFGPYNTRADVVALVDGVERVLEIFR